MKFLLKIKPKYLITFIILDSLFLFTFTFVLYGPWHGFRDFWITSSMTTMNHQYLAKWFYTNETIEKVLAQNYVQESGSMSDPNLIAFKRKAEFQKRLLRRIPITRLLFLRILVPSDFPMAITTSLTGERLHCLS